MSDLKSNDNSPAAAPPPKRRKVRDGSADSTADDDARDEPRRALSIRDRHPKSRSITASRSPDRRSKENYYSSSRSSPRSGSRSRSRSSTRSRSRSRSRSDSRSGSRSQSRSPSRSVLLRSPSRSRSSRSVEPALRIPHTATGSTPLPRKPLQPEYAERLVLCGHSKPVSQVRISPDGAWIASASADGTIRIWDAVTGTHMDTLVGHMAGISAIAWSPDSKVLASGSDDKAIRLWDRVTGRPARAKPLLGHHNYVYSLAFSPKGNILASGSYDEAVFLWDVRAGRLMRSLPAHSDPVSGIDFSRDGTLVVSCSTDGLTRMWDTSTGQCLRTMVHEDNPPVTSVCFAPNGRYVLAFSMDSCIRLWDYVSGSVKKTYQGHENSAFSIGGCFGIMDDESFIAAPSEDGDIVLWNVKSKQIVQRIEKAHDGVCFWVDVCGDIMVSCGKDGKIKVYQNGGLEEVEEEAVDGAANGVLPDELEGGQEAVPEAKASLEDSTDVADASPLKVEVDIKMEE